MQKAGKTLEIIKLTPEMAADLLENNTLNRPMSQRHADRIASQIKAGKWRFNGDTIKISADKEILDGQHRCWAVVQAQIAVETVVVTGIDKEAFSTIDTIRKMRSGSDVVALEGVQRYRPAIAGALTWLIRFQKNCIPTHRDPANRVENSDIEASFRNHPQIARAVEVATTIRQICNPSILGFFFYVLSNKDDELAERLITTLERPAGVAIDDPFFKLRAYLLSTKTKNPNSVVTIALMIKAANAAAKNTRVSALTFRFHGERPEEFPKLKV